MRSQSFLATFAFVTTATTGTTIFLHATLSMGILRKRWLLPPPDIDFKEGLGAIGKWFSEAKRTAARYILHNILRPDPLFHLPATHG
ncbi:hypothetical protein EDB89DRAFT_1964473 [Lactarius sanguifluus]|nr:hypothetical protein EDB89DRAFT_1964473 [Lactarius sanguifluus]